jgi:hypothetical protein
VYKSSIIYRLKLLAMAKKWKQHVEEEDES